MESGLLYLANWPIVLPSDDSFQSNWFLGGTCPNTLSTYSSSIHPCLNIPQVVPSNHGTTCLLIKGFRCTAQVPAQQEEKFHHKNLPSLHCHHCPRPTGLKPAWVLFPMDIWCEPSALAIIFIPARLNKEFRSNRQTMYLRAFNPTKESRPFWRIKQITQQRESHEDSKKWVSSAILFLEKGSG